MKKSEFKEEQLKELLQSMPAIHDNKNKHEYLAVLRPHFPSKKKSPHKLITSAKRLVPLTAVIAVMLIFTFFFSSFWNEVQKDYASEESSSPESSQKAAQSADSGEEEIAEKTKYHSLVSFQTNESEQTLSIPYYHEANHFFVPVSISGNTEYSIVDMLNAAEPTLTIDGVQIGTFVLADSTFSITTNRSGEQVLEIDVPANHRHGYGTASEYAFINTIKIMLLYTDIKVAMLKTDGREGITLSHYGDLSEISKPERSPSVFYLYKDHQRDYVVQAPFQDKAPPIAEAFTAMHSSGAEQLQSFIPADIRVFPKNEEQQSKQLDVEITTIQNDAPRDNLASMIEAVLLTAKTYGYETVKFSARVPLNLGQYQLNEPIDVPLALNVVSEQSTQKE